MLILTTSTSFIVQLSLVYVPFMQSIFQTAALPFSDLAVLLGLAATSATLHQFRRYYERKINADETYAQVMEELA